MQNRVEAPGNLFRLMFTVDEKIRNYHHRTSSFADKPEIPLTQIRLLSAIFLAPEGSVRIKDLAEELALTPGAVSQAVETLVRKGFLVREQDKTDRRAVSVSLSEEGHAVRNDVTEDFAGIFSELLTGVSPEDRVVFGTVLEKMLSNLKNIQIEGK